jgi:DNA-binding NarL/FixJ family response regulator
VTIRVVLADDQALVRAGLRGLLADADAAADIEVVGEAVDGGRAVEVCRATRPDVVLMDIRMPVVDGLEATRRVVSDDRLRNTRVIVLTTFELDEYVFDALRAGASGFLTKDVEPRDLRQAIRLVATGESLLSPRVTARLISEFVQLQAPTPADPGRLSALTDREREVMRQVACGLGNEEIGRQLFMSPATARTHVSRAMLKLGARDRAQLVVIAYETGLVTPGQA